MEGDQDLSSVVGFASKKLAEDENFCPSMIQEVLKEFKIDAVCFIFSVSPYKYFY